MSLSTASLPLAGAGSASADLALDARGLDALRRDADRDPDAAARRAAEQFEALFMQQLMKSMRSALPKSGLLDGPGTDTFVGMLDGQLAQTAAGRSSGLADIITKQITRHMAGQDKPPAGTDDVAAAAEAAGIDRGYGRITMGRASQGVTGAASQGGSTDVTAIRGEGAASAATRAGQAADAAAIDAAPPLGPVQAAFVERMWPHAKEAERLTGVPAAYVVGQAALESGWGRRDIRDADGNASHNLFGIKATGNWQGKTIATMTTEYVDGEAQKSVELFRRYDSYADAFTDWARLMTRNNRYAEVLRADSAASFAHGLADAGYATDPRYGEKLTRTIHQTLQHARRDR